MNKRLITFLFGLFSIAGFSQTNAIETKTVQSELKTPQMYLDSIKKTFVNHKAVGNIDKKWINELMSEDLFSAMENDVDRVYLDEDVAYDLPTDVLKERLRKLDQKSLFHIEYNETIERVIKSFLKNRSKSYERLMALSEYYFPLFEEHLAKNNVPLEIKYLAIVESALNAKARSRVGATGLWQFMYPTGKQYGLDVNSHIDERSDPILSSEAAAKYLADLYNVFGDWQLVLASYNSGPGTVSKAIRRSGGKTDYWQIRKNLPKETQGYVPAFIATMYIYEYHKEHGIVPKRANIPYVKTDTVHLKQAITFDEISNLIDIPVDEIKLLNPKYKLDMIPFYDGKMHSLRLPIDKIGRFTSNEKKIYAYLNYEKEYKKAKMIIEEYKEPYEEEAIVQRSVKSSQYYTVRKGDNLGQIASRNNLSVAELKKLNGLKTNSIAVGKKLKIAENTKYIASATPAKKVSASEASKAKSASKAVMYTVKKGDTLDGIAKKYGNISVADLMKINNIKSAKSLRPGMKLKVI